MNPKVKAAIAAAAVALGGATYAVGKKSAPAPEHEHHQAQFEAGYDDPMLRHRK